MGTPDPVGDAVRAVEAGPPRVPESLIRVTLSTARTANLVVPVDFMGAEALDVVGYLCRQLPQELEGQRRPTLYIGKAAQPAAQNTTVKVKLGSGRVIQVKVPTDVSAQELLDLCGYVVRVLPADLATERDRLAAQAPPPALAAVE